MRLLFYFIISILLILSQFNLSALQYIKKGEALKMLLPADQKLYKEKIKITKDQAAYLNDEYNGDYIKGEKFIIYFSRNEDGDITDYAVLMTEIIYEYSAYHIFAIGFNGDKSVKEVIIVELTDEVVYIMNNELFLDQFKDSRPEELELSENIDAVTGATESSELLILSIKKARYLIDLLEVK